MFASVFIYLFSISPLCVCTGLVGSDGISTFPTSV